MLAIKFKDSEGFEEEWHIGEPCPIGIDSIEDVSMIQADGHELQHILDQYYSLETSNSTIPSIQRVRVMRWCGSIAQTIIANLI